MILSVLPILLLTTLPCLSFPSSPAKNFSGCTLSFNWGAFPLQVLGQDREGLENRLCFPTSPLSWNVSQVPKHSPAHAAREVRRGPWVCILKVTGLVAPSLSISWFSRWNSTKKFLIPPSPQTEPNCLVNRNQEAGRVGKGYHHLKCPGGSLTWFSELSATVKSKTRIQKNLLIWVPCWQPEQNSSLLEVLPSPGYNTVTLPDRNCMCCPKATPLKGFIYKAVKHYWTQSAVFHIIFGLLQKKSIHFLKLLACSNHLLGDNLTS